MAKGGSGRHWVPFRTRAALHSPHEPATSPSKPIYPAPYAAHLVHKCHHLGAPASGAGSDRGRLCTPGLPNSSPLQGWVRRMARTLQRSLPWWWWHLWLATEPGQATRRPNGVRLPMWQHRGRPRIGGTPTAGSLELAAGGGGSKAELFGWPSAAYHVNVTIGAWGRSQQRLCVDTGSSNLAVAGPQVQVSLFNFYFSF